MSVQYSTTPRTPASLQSPLIAETASGLRQVMRLHSEVYGLERPTRFRLTDNQTSSGLFLHAPFGRPQSFFTPWGEMGWTLPSKPELFELFAARVEMRLAVKPYATETGQFGPLYEVVRIGGVALPGAIWTHPHHTLGSDTIKQSFEEQLPELLPRQPLVK